MRRRYSPKYRPYRVFVYSVFLSICALLVFLTLYNTIRATFLGQATIRESLWLRTVHFGRLAAPLAPQTEIGNREPRTR